MSIIAEISITAILATLGKWAKGEGVTARFAVAGGIVILFLFIIQGMNEKLAQALGGLILFTALLTYGPIIAAKSGLTSSGIGRTLKPGGGTQGSAGGGGFSAG
jgi:hypothetical protein